jgi:hypothetical protein
MKTFLSEVMPELFSRSEVLVWNFAEITAIDEHKNIQKYMQEQEEHGQDPRDAYHRQTFNNQVLGSGRSRYLIGRYLENRRDILKGSHIEQQGRTYHLAIDIFSMNQEPVFAPCSGRIVVSAKEPGLHNYGNYLILRPDDTELPYIFFGHLADNKHAIGKVAAGEQIAQLGSFEHEENGGWSIHLHLQLLTVLPAKGEAPIGYSTLGDLEKNKQLFPDPKTLFPDWRIKR